MRKGLTLVELAIVMIILGIIAGVGIPVTMAMAKRGKVQETENTLNEIRQALLTYFALNGTFPPPGPGNTVPTESLALPQEYKFDKLTGKAIYYYRDNNLGDTVKIDNIPMGERSAVLISAGANGIFDGQDTVNKRFLSTGGSGFDDILTYISELDLKALGISTSPSSPSSCQSYNILVLNQNRQGYTDYVRVLYPGYTSPAYTIPVSSVYSISNLPSNAIIQVSQQNDFNQTETNFFNVASYNEGQDCQIYLFIYSHLSTGAGRQLPIITPDLWR